LKCAK